MQDPLAPSSDERTWAALCHLSALSAFVVGIGFLVGPLVVWLIKKDQMPFVDRAGKEAINFNISFLLWVVASAVLLIVIVGFVLLPVVLVTWVVLVIVAGIRASNGQDYRYPLTIRFVR